MVIEKTVPVIDREVVDSLRPSANVKITPAVAGQPPVLVKAGSAVQPSEQGA